MVCMCTVLLYWIIDLAHQLLGWTPTFWQLNFIIENDLKKWKLNFSISGYILFTRVYIINCETRKDSFKIGAGLPNDKQRSTSPIRLFLRSVYVHDCLKFPVFIFYLSTAHDFITVLMQSLITIHLSIDHYMVSISALGGNVLCLHNIRLYIKTWCAVQKERRRHLKSRLADALNINCVLYLLMLARSNTKI